MGKLLALLHVLTDRLSIDGLEGRGTPTLQCSHFGAPFNGLGHYA